MIRAAKIAVILMACVAASSAQVVDPAANAIVDSTGSLRPFAEKLKAQKEGGRSVVTILHIGDSHVQAGFWTGRVRELIQRDYGNAGRGLIIPHKLAGMNEARDYAITTKYARRASKETGPTGVAVTCDVPYCEFGIWSKDPFSSVTVLHAEDAPPLFEPVALSTGIYCGWDNTPVSTAIPLIHNVDSLTLSGFVHGQWTDATYHGFILGNGRAGVQYHAVGLNGAAFETFAGMADGALKMLAPDLIIVSLGTNNCFGNNFREGQLYNVVDDFVRRTKGAYRDVPVLLTTPMEACRRARGRYNPNPNIGAAARIISDVAGANDVAYWDFYAAAGGTGAMARWYAEGLANRDRIHLTENGYLLQGDMFYDALAQYIEEAAAPADTQPVAHIGGKPQWWEYMPEIASNNI